MLPGMLETITNAKTLREIQVEGNRGVKGAEGGGGAGARGNAGEAGHGGRETGSQSGRRGSPSEDGQ